MRSKQRCMLARTMMNAVKHAGFKTPYCNVDGTVLYSVFINEGTMMGNDVRSLTCPEDESNQRWVKLSRPFT